MMNPLLFKYLLTLFTEVFAFLYMNPFHLCNLKNNTKVSLSSTSHADAAQIQSSLIEGAPHPGSFAAEYDIQAHDDRHADDSHPSSTMNTHSHPVNTHI
ncbi:hypothetical protein L1887_24090 [Cichorium endivia]|nr:hypothetical protein L1887_24090 [Cichorium endivia]